MAAPEGYKALGKIGISYKGEYASNTAYERLDAVAHNGSTYLAIKDAPDGAPRDDKVNWIYLAKGFSGDVGNSEIEFTEAETRENIDTGESVKTVFCKIKKWFNDMTVAAFAQVITSNEDLMALTRSGYLVDALAVKNQFAEVNSKLTNFVTVNFITIINGGGKIIETLNNNIVEISIYGTPFIYMINENTYITNTSIKHAPSVEQPICAFGSDYKIYPLKLMSDGKLLSTNIIPANVTLSGIIKYSI